MLTVYYLFIAVVTQNFVFDRTDGIPYLTKLACVEAKAEADARLMAEQLESEPNNAALFVTFCKAIDLSKSARPGERNL